MTVGFDLMGGWEWSSGFESMFGGSGVGGGKLRVNSESRECGGGSGWRWGGWCCAGEYWDRLCVVREWCVMASNPGCCRIGSFTDLPRGAGAGGLFFSP